MNFLAKINIMPQKAILDPQGKAVHSSAKKIGFDNILNIRIGKHIEMEINANSMAEAENYVNDICKKILINPIVENYEFELNEIK